MKTTSKFTKLILAALTVCLVFALASCQFIAGSLELKSFTVDRSTVKTVYIVGDEIDFSGIKATAIYSDENLNKVYTFDELTITYPDDITATPGQKSVKVSFLDPHLNVTQETSVQITVNEDPFAVKHASYRVDASAVKTNYNIGETVDFSGIKLYERFSDGSEVEITDLAGISYTPALEGLTDTTGNKSVKVQYNGEDAGAITVKVIDPEEEKNHVVSVVVGGEYKTSYEVNETIDLTGLTITVTYEEGEVMTVTHESVTAEAVDMSVAGTKTVVISFRDPINNEEDFESITITVVKKDVVAQFEKPATIIAFDSNNKNAGTLNFGDTGFQGQYLKGGKVYIVGDDNPFGFVPQFAIEENGIPKTLTAFYSNVDIYVLVDGSYVLLTKTVDATNPALFTYTDSNGDVIASVDTYRGSYQFGSAAVGKMIKLSVLPSENYYKLEGANAVTLELTVIDAYNVSEAWQLAVIDTDTSRTDWDAFKNEKGIANYSPAGIVLHGNIHIGVNDVPASFFHVSTKDVTYTNSVTGATSVAPAGTRYLKDWTMVYKRTGTADFVIQGNFFNIDTKNFPLIPSPAVFDSDLEYDYGNDYSNASLFMFESISANYGERPEDPSDVLIENVSFIGNASRDNWVDENGSLVTAGGLILIKSSRHTTTTLNNVLNNSFFIAYFPDFTGYMFLNDCKCFDSYQNAAFVWANSQFIVNDSFLSGSGGPLVIAMSIEDNGLYHNPITKFNNTKLDNHITGEEVWFKAVGATAIVPQIKALGSGVNTMLEKAGAMFGASFKGSWVDAKGQMNIKAVLMPEAENAEQALTDAMIQGTIHVDGVGIDRWYDPTSESFNMEWATILQSQAFAAGAPFITVHDAAGNAHTVYFVQQGNSGTFYDLSGNVLGSDPANHAAIIQAFATADEIILNQGGLSIIFEMYH